MNTDPILRITLDVIVFVATLLGWWFVALPLAVIGAWVFPRYIEIVFAGLAHDMLFSMDASGQVGIAGYAYLAGSAIILGVVSYLKAVVKNHT